MKYIRQLFLVSALILAVTSATFGAAQPGLNAQESVDNYISHLFERVLEVKSLYNTDPEGYNSALELALAEFVDFSEVARGVMAKYGSGENGANEAQLQRFTEVFKVDMIDFYGSALSTYEGEEYVFLEPRRAPRDPENATSVRMKIESDDGSSVEVQYVMFLNQERVWKLKNLYIEGVNLRRQYYSRFDNLMARNDYNIDKVIDLWLEQN